jgi:hypothetical protein
MPGEYPGARPVEDRRSKAGSSPAETGAKAGSKWEMVKKIVEDVDLAFPRTTQGRTVWSQQPTRRKAMQYLLLIYGNEADRVNATKADMEAMFGQYRDFTQSIIQSGHMRAGDALQPTTTATTVRIRDGKTLRTDGPFAETKEQLGGFYLIEARDLNEAIRLASRMPPARIGCIEVRPLKEFDPR